MAGSAAAKKGSGAEAPPARKPSRAERRHGAKYRPVEEPSIQIPKVKIVSMLDADSS